MFIRPLSLPTRLSLAVTAVLVVTTVLADVMAMRELRKTLTRSVSSSLSGMVRRMAEQLDRDIGDLLGLLEKEAERIAGMPGDGVAAYLARENAALDLLFDYGLILVDASGKVTADSRQRDFWAGINLAGEEFFQRTFALGRPLVSEPFAMPDPQGTAAVLFTAPIRDASGRIVSILAGGWDLARNRVVNQSTGVRVSRFGQIGVFTPDGRVVAHGDKAMLLEQYENPLPERWPEGGSTVETVTADGAKAILAVCHLRNADWLMAGVFPSAEIYSSINEGFDAAHLWFALGLAACCLLVWLLAGRGVRDLGLLAREVEHIGTGEMDQGSGRVGEGYRGEAAMLAGAVNHMLDSLDAARRDIDDLSSRLAGAEERERRAVAADLHDSVCQNLALVNMRLGGLKKRLDGSPEAETIALAQGILEEAVAEARTLTFNLSPGILYELGLVPALEWHAREFSRKYGLPVEVSGDGDLSDMDEDEAIFLYRAAGELLINAAKHSGAGEITVRAAREGDDVVLRVTDDGKGMSASADGRSGSGFGLRNLRQRTRQFHGVMHLEAADGGGTQVTLRAPFAARRS